MGPGGVFFWFLSVGDRVQKKACDFAVRRVQYGAMEVKPSS